MRPNISKRCFIFLHTLHKYLYKLLQYNVIRNGFLITVIVLYYITQGEYNELQTD